MNVLYVGTLPPHPGGTAIFGAYLLTGLAALGHSVRALAPITPAALTGGDAFAVRHGHIPIQRYLVPAFEDSPNLPAPRGYRALERAQIQAHLPALTARQRPDVLVIGRETFAWHVPELARALAIPSVLLVHGGTQAGIMAGTLPSGTARRLLAHYRKADLIVTVARHLAATLATLGFEGVPAVPNPVDLARFRPRPPDPELRRSLRIEHRDIVVAHVSNLKTLKRPMDILYSAERALGEDPRLVYLIVGDGSWRGAMEDWCRGRRIASRIRFVGWVDHDRVPAYLNLADMVAMPSESEGQALVYLETQACGRLLLASDIPAAREVITDGETGLLSPAGHVEALADRTLRAARDPLWRRAIGDRARAQVQVHASDRVARRYADLLAGVARRRSGGRPSLGSRASAEQAPQFARGE